MIMSRIERRVCWSMLSCCAWNFFLTYRALINTHTHTHTQLTHLLEVELLLLLDRGAIAVRVKVLQ